LVVHRLLDAALTLENSKDEIEKAKCFERLPSTQEIATISEIANERKLLAKHAGKENKHNAKQKQPKTNKNKNKKTNKNNQKLKQPKQTQK